jgi:hypothetical protein
VQCNLKIEIKDANGNVVSQIDSLAAGYAPAWTHYQSGTFLPLTAPITLNIYTNIPGSAGGNDLSIDDIVVEQCSNLNIGPDTTICNTASIVLNAGGVAGNYIWSVGSTNPSIVASTSNPGVSTTTYYVQVMDTGGCIFKDTATVTFTICTGIENLIKENPLVFSQPLKEYLQLYDASGILSVSIYDLSGAKVKKYNSQEIFYVGDLPSGYYLFHAEKTDGERLIIKFLKE